MPTSGSFLPPSPRLNRPLLPIRIPTPKLESCAKCPLAHTVAYGNKTNTGNHFKRHLNPTPSIAQSDRPHHSSTGKEAHTMASNEIAILDPAASVDKLNKIAADRAMNRRRFIAALGITGAAAGAGLLSGCANNTTMPISSPLGAGQTDILNFVLNVEYLQATFYAYLTTGADLPPSVTGNGPTPVS